MKKCNFCGELKENSSDNFYIRSTGKIDTTCKVCCRKKAEARRRAKGVKSMESRRVSKEHKLKLQREANKRYREKNRETINAKNKERRKTSKYRNTLKKWKEKNSDKISEDKKNYYKKNKHKYIEKAAQRRFKTEKTSIAKKFKQDTIAVYKLCEKVNNITGGINFHVDHIIPVNGGDLVCGLHVPWNLQVLLKSYNWKKSNKFDGTNLNESWVEEFLNNE